MSTAETDEFESFARDVRAMLVGSVLSMHRDWNEAEDLAQEALLLVHEHWTAIQHPTARATYARTVVLRLAQRTLAKARFRKEVSGAEFEERSAGPATEFSDRLVRQVLLGELIETLPSSQRTIIRLRYWADLTTDEIARLLSRPPGTVRSDLCRAHANLRRALHNGCA